MRFFTPGTRSWTFFAKRLRTVSAFEDIQSILAARDEETSLLAGITDTNDDDGIHDVVVASWMQRLDKRYTVRFEEMFNQDVASRLREDAAENMVNEEIAANERPGNTPLAELVDLVNTMKKEIGEQLKTIEHKVDGLDKRVTPLEAYVKKQLKEGGESSKAWEGDAADVFDVADALENPPDDVADVGEKNRGKRPAPTGVDNFPSRPMTRSRTNEVKLTDAVEVFYEDKWRKGYVRAILKELVRVSIYDSGKEHDFKKEEIRHLPDEEA